MKKPPGRLSFAGLPAKGPTQPQERACTIIVAQPPRIGKGAETMAIISGSSIRAMLESYDKATADLTKARADMMAAMEAYGEAAARQVFYLSLAGLCNPLLTADSNFYRNK